MKQTTWALATGSRVYGAPTDDSDVDVVLLTDKATFDRLCREDNDRHPAKTTDSKLGDGGEKDESASLRFGSLNLIVTTSEKAFGVWVTGTEHLKTEAPVTREHAVATFKKLRAEAGL